MALLKKILNRFHPVLKPLSLWYLSRQRTFFYKGIKIKIRPGVFHPGFFFSTKILLAYLDGINIENKRVLELGAGTGVISIYCNRKGAVVSASDISKTAIQCIYENANLNNAQLTVIESDLFDRINPADFDIIIINPPYYPKSIESEKDVAWFCGVSFEYFQKLFEQLKDNTGSVEIFMILSEDCDFVRIQNIAKKNSLRLVEIFTVRKFGEWNFIYRISE